MPDFGGGTGDEYMADRFVIHLKRVRESDKETTKATPLFAPAMRDRQAIHYQVFAFMFSGANAQRFVLADVALCHKLPADPTNDALPAFVLLIGVMEATLL